MSVRDFADSCTWLKTSECQMVVKQFIEPDLDALSNEAYEIYRTEAEANGQPYFPKNDTSFKLVRKQFGSLVQERKMAQYSEQSHVQDGLIEFLRLRGQDIALDAMVDP
ncbi:unnamed protein product [Ilex paraguariensis]|uniref:Uncharacterized protein n=1 Tax=Ilex paraguariensis TaxID=185542 RepID=A0ABC8QN60_9AQUA